MLVGIDLLLDFGSADSGHQSRPSCATGYKNGHASILLGCVYSNRNEPIIASADRNLQPDIPVRVV
jgi:hypothetical protein